MKSGLDWTQLALALSILLALFVYPVVVLWADERKKRRARLDAGNSSD